MRLRLSIGHQGTECRGTHKGPCEPRHRVPSRRRVDPRNHFHFSNTKVNLVATTPNTRKDHLNHHQNLIPVFQSSSIQPKSVLHLHHHHPIVLPTLRHNASHPTLKPSKNNPKPPPYTYPPQRPHKLRLALLDTLNRRKGYTTRPLPRPPPTRHTHRFARKLHWGGVARHGRDGPTIRLTSTITHGRGW
jgi:hypothetical protein